jgi:hypothetical protein
MWSAATMRKNPYVIVKMGLAIRKKLNKHWRRQIHHYKQYSNLYLTHLGDSGNIIINLSQYSFNYPFIEAFFACRPPMCGISNQNH